MILCASEIFLYLDENLKLTPQAMSDKAAPMDELEDMHQRVGILKSSSLLHCLFFFSFFFCMIHSVLLLSLMLFIFMCMCVRLYPFVACWSGGDNWYAV